MHRNTKGIDEMLYAVGQPPNWVLKAMKYVVKVPSAVNVRLKKTTTGVLAGSIPTGFKG